MPKPNIDQLLIDSALQPDLCRRLRESPEEIFRDYDLTVEETVILRQPDHRLLSLIGAAVARQLLTASAVEKTPAVAASPPVSLAAQPMPDTLMALTIVPCALRENGEFKGITYVVWMNNLPAGTDPASISAPAGTVFPGQPLAPLRALIRISATPLKDATGNPQLSMSGTFQPLTSWAVPPPPESAGDVAASPFQSPVDSPQVKAAVAAARGASNADRYDRILDLLYALRQGDVR